MSGAQTRGRLLDSAERLMAANGISATSVREVTEDAGANIAAINYYFGGKDELLLTILKTGFDELDAILHKKLTQLEKTHQNGSGSPPLEEIVVVYFDTLLDLGVDPQTGKRDPFINLIQRAASERAVILDRAQDYEAPGIAKFTDMVGATASPPVDLHAEIEIFISLIFDAAVSAMSVITAEGREAPGVDAIRAFAATGVQGYLAVRARFADVAGPD